MGVGWLLLLFALAAPALCGATASYLDDSNSLDEGMLYAVLSPSTEEWERTFGGVDGDMRGPLHLWLRCVDGLGPSPVMRSYFFVESVDYLRGAHWREKQGWAAVQRVPDMSSFRFEVNGSSVALSSWDQSGGGSFLFALRERNGWAMGGVVSVGVAGWSAYVDFPLDSCVTVAPPSGRNRPLVVTGYMFDEGRTEAPYVHTPLASVSRAFALHALYCRSALNASAYEVIVPRSAVAALLAEPTLAELFVDGFFRLLLKPPRPAQLSGMDGYEWQGVHTNLALLRRWAGNELMLFLDPDEFLVYSAGATIFARKHAVSAFIITRNNVACSDFTDELGDMDSLRKSAVWLQDKDTYLPDKMAVFPRDVGVMYIHNVDAARHAVRVRTRDAVIYHFVNLFKRRVKLAHTAAPVPLPAALLTAAAAMAV
jgi:hypothetical protein